MSVHAAEIIPKRTVAVLFNLVSSIDREYDLGGGVSLKRTDHDHIRKAMDEYLATLRSDTREAFTTYMSPPEREDFERASHCFHHNFEAPDFVGESEERSKAEIQSVLTAMRVIKPTLAQAGLRLGWEFRETGWGLRGFDKGGAEIYHAPDEEIDAFGPEDIALLIQILPRVRHAYSLHGSGRYTRLANALNFFETGYRSNWAPVRFVVFTTALEGLFITSDKKIGLQFKDRIPRILASESNTRVQLQDLCHKIYRTRSGIVHGEAALDVFRNVDSLMLDLQDIGRRCLQKVLGRDFLFEKFFGTPLELQTFLSQL